jgi:hypothetical protein
VAGLQALVLAEVEALCKLAVVVVAAVQAA